MSQAPLQRGVAEMLPAAGHIFENKYRIVQPIGAGGFARVYRARFEDVARDVAIKVLVPELEPPQLYPEELVSRFLREARAVSELRSPHTITLHDFGRTRSGLLYMVFEFVDGVSLDQVVRRLGPLSPERTVNVMRQVLLSLREAHMRGLLHRDIKPANLMLYDYLGDIDQVKVLDFGIAKRWTHEADGQPMMGDLTEAGTVVGTPRYMSPEQIVGQALSPATDMYSLGLVVYELLVGSPAAPEKERTAVVRRHLGPEPILLPAHLQTNSELAAMVHRMLAKDHRARYQSADEALAALSRIPLAASSGPQPFVANHGSASSQHAIVFTAQNQARTTGPGGITQTQLGGWGQQAGAASISQSPPKQQPWGAMPRFVGASQVIADTEVSAAEQQQQQGWASSPSGSAPGGAVVKPERTFVQLRAAPGTFEMEVPPKPTKKAMLIAVATGVFFMVAFIATSLTFLALPIAAGAFAWGLSLVFRQFRLIIHPDSGYEIGTSVLGQLERFKRGPAQSLVRFEARGSEADEDNKLVLITHEGEFLIADGLSDTENNWIAATGNHWIEAQRRVSGSA